MIEVKCAHSKMVAIDLIVPNPYNTNKHPKKQINALSKIIKDQGWRHPIVVSKRSGFIISGHGRLEAAILLGEKEAPVDEQEFKTEAEEFIFLNADNNISKYAEFDTNLMLSRLNDLDISLDEFDFTDVGLIDFTFEIPELDADVDDDDDESDESDENKKYILEVQLPNELELRDLYDDLISKGHLVKEK